MAQALADAGGRVCEGEDGGEGEGEGEGKDEGLVTVKRRSTSGSSTR